MGYSVTNLVQFEEEFEVQEKGLFLEFIIAIDSK